MPHHAINGLLLTTGVPVPVPVWRGAAWCGAGNWDGQLSDDHEVHGEDVGVVEERIHTLIRLMRNPCGREPKRGQLPWKDLTSCPCPQVDLKPSADQRPERVSSSARSCADHENSTSKKRAIAQFKKDGVFEK